MCQNETTFKFHNQETRTIHLNPPKDKMLKALHENTALAIAQLKIRAGSRDWKKTKLIQYLFKETTANCHHRRAQTSAKAEEAYEVK